MITRRLGFDSDDWEGTTGAARTPAGWFPLAMVAASCILFGACGGGGGGSSAGGTTSSARAFSTPPVLEETVRMEDSASPEFWLPSGAKFMNDGDAGRTLQGELSADDPWRTTYARTNPTDSDDGFHPQNVFRLVSRTGVENFSEEVVFRVIRTNASDSPNRDGSNGVFTLLRFVGRDDTYAAGVRVDGNAVIKKKRGGRFTTLAINPLFSNGAPYDRAANPNLIPLDRAVRLEGRIRTRAEGDVALRLLVDGQVVLEAIDGGSSGGPMITGQALGGIASDFMDVEFDGLTMRPLAGGES
jgi:hypothetical protein